MSCNPTPDGFKNIYLDDLNLGDKVSRKLKPLHDVCLHSKNCWKGLSTAHHQEDERAKIYHPYIGEKYQDLKLLCLGINMNNYGGFDACDNLVKKARDEMENGAIKVRFGNNYKEYSGTYLYHRMGVYSKIIAEAFGISESLTHISAFDFIAYTNHVKCSPKNGKRSKPCWEMWNNCGDFILKKELEILQPNILLVLGKSDNYWWLNEKVFDKGCTEPPIPPLRRVRLVKTKLDGRDLKVIVMPHPSSNSGIAKKLQSDLQEILSSNPSFL